MSPSVLAINVGVGLVFVLLWGLLSYVASSEAEFKSYFFGGLANFVFFVGGCVAAYLSSVSASKDFPQPTHPVVAIPGAYALDAVGAVYVGLATTFVLLLINLFQEGNNRSLEKLRSLRTVDFTPDGYRDLQLFLGGSVAILGGLCGLAYGLYLGSVRPGMGFATVLVGVGLPLGVYAILYVTFGLLFDLQIFQVLKVTSPEVVGIFGPVLRRAWGLL